jgi:hypothetical protein
MDVYFQLPEGRKGKVRLKTALFVELKEEGRA